MLRVVSGEVEVEGCHQVLKKKGTGVRAAEVGVRANPDSAPKVYVKLRSEKMKGSKTRDLLRRGEGKDRHRHQAFPYGCSPCW